mmetsp:Transcript_17624/g.61636  ORF Transcript_17624/g.61636 Transcript_17624/m.61636 type:complete len:278 (+) Transcript_17624:2401-3234(+)
MCRAEVEGQRQPPAPPARTVLPRRQHLALRVVCQQHPALDAQVPAVVAHLPNEQAQLVHDLDGGVVQSCGAEAPQLLCARHHVPSSTGPSEPVLEATLAPTLLHFFPCGGPIGVHGSVQAVEPIRWTAREEAFLAQRLRGSFQEVRVRRGVDAQAGEGQDICLSRHPVLIVPHLPEAQCRQQVLLRHADLLHGPRPRIFDGGQALHDRVELVLGAPEESLPALGPQLEAVLEVPLQGPLLLPQVVTMGLPRPGPARLGGVRRRLGGSGQGLGLLLDH